MMSPWQASLVNIWVSIPIEQADSGEKRSLKTSLYGFMILSLNVFSIIDIAHDSFSLFQIVDAHDLKQFITYRYH